MIRESVRTYREFVATRRKKTRLVVLRKKNLKITVPWLGISRKRWKT